MKGYVNEIYKIYEGQDKNLVIPVYQRNYDWTVKQCGRLFDDLEAAVAAGGRKHFFGAVVGVPEDSFHWVVIDGQQRLTSVSLLMLALVRAIESGEIAAADPHLARRIMRNYLVSPGDDGGSKVRLKPIKDDAAAYTRLFEDPDDLIETSNVTANYRYFRERLRGTEYTAEQLWEDGICKLEVMWLDLEPHDRPQRIFESLNSTGLGLSEADKIRNFVLMDLPVKDQEWLYENRWNKIEKTVDFRTDWFIRLYLITETGNTPKRSDVYEAFKTYVARSGRDVEEILGEMLIYAKASSALVNADTGHREVDARLGRFNIIAGDVVLPPLIALYRQADEEATTWADFLHCVKILEIFLFRRMACGLTTGGLNKVFATLFGELKKLRRHGEDFADILTHSLLTRTGSARMPRDEEFLADFSGRDFYHVQRHNRWYLFEALENGESADVRDIARGLESGELTVEHIMPQTLSTTWRREIGPDAARIHDAWLHRVANLTVTGYNSAYSNASFAKKRDMPDGFADTPYRLNDTVRGEETWGLAQLEHRDSVLTRRALECWPLPQTNFAPPAPVLPEVPMGEDENFTGRRITAYRFGETEATVKTWTDMVVGLLRTLATEHRPALVELAESMRWLRTGVSPIEELDRGWRRIDEGLTVETGNSTETKMSMLRTVFSRLDLDPDELVFVLRRVEDETVGEHKGQNSAAAVEDEPESQFDEILKFRDRFAEAASLEAQPRETAALCAEFLSAVRPFLVEDAQVKLGDKPLDQFLATKPATELSVEEILAVLTQLVALADIMGASAIHQRIVSGELGAWLDQLATAEAGVRTNDQLASR